MSDHADALSVTPDHRILDSLRSLVLLIDEHGTILAARGGFGGFLGFDVDAVVGTSVFDHVHPDDAHDLAQFFLDSWIEALDTIAVPMPFRLRVCSPDGLSHQVDVIPSGVPTADGSVVWTTEIVPVGLFGTSTRSLDLELAGAPRDEVCRMLCEELVVDGGGYTSRWVLIDRSDGRTPAVTTSRDEDADLVAAVAADLDAGWQPWDGVVAGETRSLAVQSVGTQTCVVVKQRGWHRVVVSPVVVDDRVVATLLLMGSVPDGFDPLEVKANVAARIRRLVQTTALLFERWATQDHLTVAASTDELTGLANRRTFYEALDAERRSSAVLFVDVDDFKSVNDMYGHEAGDRVLEAVAKRIVGACRESDLVARLGGDEFVVLARPADELVAKHLVERIESAVDRPLGLAVGPARITVSVGSAVFGERNGRHAIDVADAAMLERKRTRPTSI